MRGWCVVKKIRNKMWPPAPEAPEVKPISEEERRRVESTENQLRAELVRAQTEAMRFRILARQQDQ
jgi:hypothetical protein